MSQADASDPWVVLATPPLHNGSDPSRNVTGQTRCVTGRQGWPRSEPHAGAPGRRLDAGNDREHELRRCRRSEPDLDLFAVRDRRRTPTPHGCRRARRPSVGSASRHGRRGRTGRSRRGRGRTHRSSRGRGSRRRRPGSGSGSASASRWVWTGRRSVEASSSSARWLARSQPDWTRTSVPSGRSSVSVTSRSVSPVLLVIQRSADPDPTIVSVSVSGAERKSAKDPSGRLLPVPHDVGAPEVGRVARSSRWPGRCRAGLGSRRGRPRRRGRG